MKSVAPTTHPLLFTLMLERDLEGPFYEITVNDLPEAELHPWSATQWQIYLTNRDRTPLGPVPQPFKSIPRILQTAFPAANAGDFDIRAQERVNLKQIYWYNRSGQIYQIDLTGQAWIVAYEAFRLLSGVVKHNSWVHRLDLRLTDRLAHHNGTWIDNPFDRIVLKTDFSKGLDLEFRWSNGQVTELPLDFISEKSAYTQPLTIRDIYDLLSRHTEGVMTRVGYNKAEEPQHRFGNIWRVRTN